MIVPNANLQLLLAHNVLLGPVRVVLSVGSTLSDRGKVGYRGNNVLGNLTRLDDPLELFHHHGPDPHYTTNQ